MTGPPFSICSWNSGTTLPFEFNTLPNRTVMNRVFERAFMFWQYISATRLVAPMMLAGLTALSVEISTKVPTPCRSATSASRMVPTTLLRNASRIWVCRIGRCL